MALKNNNSYVLVLNAGSATLKWALYEVDGLVEVGRGTVERIGETASFAEWRLHGKLSIKQLKFNNHQQTLAYIIKMLAWHKILNNVTLIGHRIVHGGKKFTKPTKLTKEVIKHLEKISDLAPLHNPIQLMVVKEARKLLPDIKQSAVFDTAWFAHLPPESQFYALPQSIIKKYDLRKYGFHGLSHSYVTLAAAKILKKAENQVNLITCHLGSGSSVSAVRNGKLIDTTMGFTPLEGLIMCTRAGDLDPGLILFLLRQPGMSIKKLDRILNHESGLKGLTGVADMREVLIQAGYEILGFNYKNPVTAKQRQQARLALKMYLYRLQKYIGAYAAILGRVDAIIFTGGIGERNELIRNLTMLGLPNLKTVPILAIPTNEELAIARQIMT